MAQSRNYDPHDRDLDIKTCLIEHEEVESMPLGKIDTGHHLLALVETAKVKVIVRLDRRVSVRRQIRVIPQIKRRGAILVRWPGVARSHQAYGKKLVHLSKRAQQRNARVEMCAGAVLDKVMTILHGVRQRHKTRNPEIAGDVEHPKLPSGLGKLGFEITDIRIVKPAQIQFRPLRS